MCSLDPQQKSPNWKIRLEVELMTREAHQWNGRLGSKTSLHDANTKLTDYERNNTFLMELLTGKKPGLKITTQTTWAKKEIGQS